MALEEIYEDIDIATRNMQAAYPLMDRYPTKSLYYHYSQVTSSMPSRLLASYFNPLYVLAGYKIEVEI